jgi:hypothetical protein
VTGNINASTLQREKRPEKYKLHGLFIGVCPLRSSSGTKVLVVHFSQGILYKLAGWGSSVRASLAGALGPHKTCPYNKMGSKKNTRLPRSQQAGVCFYRFNLKP